jgi:DNA-binding HxlR family transcriptional regulator
MTRKRYDMYCAVARALEVLGERWTLLVVRELLTGPKRYADLQAGLPGIATNMLTERLRSLQDAGAVTQRTLPAPAASAVYELTQRGEALKPVLQTLGMWGLPLLDEPRPTDQFRLPWLMIALDAAYDPTAAPDPLTVVLDIDGERLTIHAHGSSHEVIVPSDDGHSEAAEPSAGTRIVVRGNREAFLGWVTGRLSARRAASAGLVVTPRQELGRLRRLYPVPRSAAPKAAAP